MIGQAIRRIYLCARLRAVHAQVDAFEHFKRHYDRHMLALLQRSANLRAETFYLEHGFNPRRLSSALLAGHSAGGGAFPHAAVGVTAFAAARRPYERVAHYNARRGFTVPGHDFASADAWIIEWPAGTPGATREPGFMANRGDLWVQLALARAQQGATVTPLFRRDTATLQPPNSGQTSNTTNEGNT